MDIDKKAVYQNFLAAFPIEGLQSMQLDQYTNLNRNDSFCYWLEKRTQGLGSIWGGTSFKFGIYQYVNKPDDTRVVSDNTYAWYSCYNKSTAEEAFQVVREAIVKIAKYAQNKEWEEVEKIKILGDAVKWKIAFLYSNLSLVPFFTLDKLQQAAKSISINLTGQNIMKFSNY